MGFNKTLYCFSGGFLLLLLFSITASAQAFKKGVSGKLTDEKGTPVSYANVTLLKGMDGAFVAGVVTDTAGNFLMKAPAAGSYLLRFTAIGFSEKKTEPFDVTDAEFSKNFGVIPLKTEAKTLAEVSVLALRPTITQLADRMVVNVDGTAMAAGNTAYAVLSRAPGVFIDADGNIQLNGRSGVTVMIDGKLTYLSARDLRIMLEAMPAENLKNIEIITNPSAKYDAEGNSGILNINLKKNTQQGINGSVYTTYNYNFKQQHGGTIGGNINHKKGKWNSFLNVDAARRVGGRDATFTRIFYGDKTTYFDQEAGQVTITPKKAIVVNDTSVRSQPKIFSFDAKKNHF